MPDVQNAITITTSVTVNPNPIQPWGIPCIIGESTYATKNTYKKYTSLAVIGTDHGTGSNVYKAASSMWTQGIRELYALSLTVASAGSPTATEVETALTLIDSLVSAGEIQGVCLAGISGTTATTLFAKLITAIDRCKIIGVMASASGMTAAQCVTQLGSVASNNAYYVAWKSSTAAGYDVAASVLGAMFSYKPWSTMAWKEFTGDIDGFWTPAEVATIEAAKGNCVIRYDSSLRLSNGMTTAASLRYIDVTRTQYETEKRIKESIASGRMSADKVPYTERGLEVVRGWIISAMEGMKREGALASYTITMPVFANITSGDKASRVLNGVEIGAVLAGDIQSFNLSLAITV